MSAWYMLLDPKFAVHPGPGRAIGGAMGNLAGRKPFSLVAVFKSWMTRRQAINELSALNDRLLNDIGISRYEIPAIVDGVRTAANVHRINPVPVNPVGKDHDEVLAA